MFHARLIRKLTYKTPSFSRTGFRGIGVDKEIQVNSVNRVNSGNSALNSVHKQCVYY